MKFLILPVIATMFLLVGQYLNNMVNWSDEYMLTYGTIERVISTESKKGTIYFIRVQINGKKYVTRSISYHVTNRKYRAGDKVRVKAFYTKNGDIMTLIDDDELISNAEEAKKNSKYLFIIAAVFYILTLVFLIKYFLIK